MTKQTLLRKSTLRDFRLDQVTLTGAYHANAFAKELQYLHSYEADRLLAGFRETKGLEPKAEKYPGWENTEIRGHTLGHFLTACAQAYSSTKDPVLLEKLNYIVSELSESQFDSGYLSAFPESLIDNIERKQPAWVPWYTMHKIIAGLISVYHATQSRAAFDTVVKLGDWVASRTSLWSDELQATVLAVEYGGMNACLYDLYKISGDRKHLDAAHKFDELPLFEAIRQGRDILKGKHANTTIPKFLGALNRYLAVGESERSYFEAAERFWDIVVYQHSYITGGNSENEHFGEPDKLDGRRTDVTCETCNSYNMLKLTRELFKLTGDRKYADYYERNYVNAILSSQNPDTGMTMYFQPMATGYFKIYSSPFEHFWCCTGTGMESFTKLNDSIYFHNANELFINQYISSKLNWEEQQITLTQSSGIPENDRVTIKVETDGQAAKELKLHLRIPYWIKGEIEAKVNGAPAAAERTEHGLVIGRKWSDGDTLELTLPMGIIVSRLPDNKYAAGFQYGPVVLSAALGTEDLSKAQTGIMVQVPTRKMLVKDFIIPAGMSPEQWLDGIDRHLVKEEGGLTFRLRHTDEDERLVFTPHYKQHRERYGIYWNIVEADSEQLKRHLELGRMEQLIKDATIDSVQVGNDQYELQHEIKGEETFGGAWDGQNGRLAHAGGWFSYKMAVEPGGDNQLQVTYFLLNHNRVMNIYVNGSLLVSEKLSPERKRQFVTQNYPIPAGLIDGKEHAEFKFVPEDKVNGIYGMLRTMRPLSEL
ncbi:glycoside hydrolase family 127 protein [Paenibacillus sp. N4]|uniref:glycoside hydrolase family 127 protein n=1 Tax=Paenibacillus vietnamensis TaxID=2590547 RepID=UPI001CD11F62|nr:beta-L-arabinofuranosidase domain-containing protein [Paenibacillus vietnamensis]MCA0755451.1 glycoside hydrolase family 127 protein [Paenibacillus vietnamensis]